MARELGADHYQAVLALLAEYPDVPLNELRARLEAAKAGERVWSRADVLRLLTAGVIGREESRRLLGLPESGPPAADVQAMAAAVVATIRQHQGRPPGLAPVR